MFILKWNISQNLGTGFIIYLRKWKLHELSALKTGATRKTVVIKFVANTIAYKVKLELHKKNLNLISEEHTLRIHTEGQNRCQLNMYYIVLHIELITKGANFTTIPLSLIWAQY